jgi:hypothetical protein
MLKLKTLGASLIIFLFFYFNFVSLCATLNLRFKPIVDGYYSILPTHWTLHRLFRVWDVFDRWGEFNIGFKAFGSYETLEKPPMNPEASLIDLDVYSYFPYIRGEANRRLWMTTTRHNLAITKEYQARILGVIKKIYNQQHPDKPIKQAFLYLYTWKKNPEGWSVGSDSVTPTIEAIN